MTSENDQVSIFRKPKFRDPFLKRFGDTITFEPGDTKVLAIVDQEIQYISRGASLVGTRITSIRVADPVPPNARFTWAGNIYQVDAQVESVDEQGLLRYVCSHRGVAP